MGQAMHIISKLWTFKWTWKFLQGLSANLNKHRVLWISQSYCGTVKTQEVPNINYDTRITGYGPGNEHT